jgi:hypothetical protein
MVFRFSPGRQGSTGTGNRQSPDVPTLVRTPALSLTQLADECGQLTAGASRWCMRFKRNQYKTCSGSSACSLCTVMPANGQHGLLHRVGVGHEGPHWFSLGPSLRRVECLLTYISD